MTEEKKKIKTHCWQNGDNWFGYLEDWPEYVSQAKSLEKLKEDLKELYREIRSEIVVKDMF